MKYNPPFGSIDPDASYVDRNTPGATKGSAVPAAAIEDPQREIVSVIEAAGLEPAGDEMQLATAIQSGKLNFAIAGGTANALTAALNPPPASMSAIIGAPINILTGAAPNSGSMSLNLNALGVRAILHRDGSAISPAEIPANSILSVIYDGTEFVAYTVALPAAGLSFADQPEAQGGAENTKPMTSLRVNQATHQPRASLASAATADLSSVTSQDVLITGSTGIAAFGTGRSGLWRRVTFEGSLTLTHSANLWLPNGGANIITEAGDNGLALSLGGGAWAILSYQRAKGSNPIGDRQTWQNMIGSRAANTAYQNTTGRSIDVSICCGSSESAKSFEVSTSGASWLKIGQNSYGSGSATTMQFSASGPFTIPAGNFYRIVTVDTIEVWTELR